MTLKTWRVTFSNPDYDPETITFDRFDFETNNPTDALQKALAIKVAHEMTGQWGNADEMDSPSVTPNPLTHVNES